MSVFLSASPLLSSRTQTLILNLHTSQSHASIPLNSTGNQTTHLPSIRSTPLKGLNNKPFNNKNPYVTLSANSSSSATQTINDSGKSSRKRHKKQPLLSEGRDDDEALGLVCPGCGVFMQDDDPTQPGYYQKKKVEPTDVFEDEFVLDDIEGELEDIDEGETEIESKFDDISDDDWEIDDEIDWESDFEDDEDDLKELDGFTAPGVGYGNITEEVLEKAKKKRVSKSERKRLAREAQMEKEEVTVCARCHSLRNYGQIKNQLAENLIPDFDFDKLISTRLMKPTGNADSTVVVMVVDCVDFDGSFPKRAAKSLFESLEGGRDGLQRSKKLPKLVLVATKVDLLPSQISPTRLDRWVRHRARAHGAPRLNGVYLVSSRKDLGVRNLLTFVKDLAGPRGHVWVIGAQNAGKSTLINAFAKKGGVKATKLTEAAVPGTTLGILRIGGVLSAKAKMYDTPGLLHPYLMSMRLTREEQKMVEIRKELRPRTYRIKQGQAIHVGGLMRLDLNEASVQTIYVTVWASPNVSLHLGKIENADEIWNKHAGVRLQPPIGVDRLSELGKWESREVKVSGTSWDVNSVDLSAAGLGWFSLGLKGEATLTLWTFDGIEITTREPLVLDRAPFLERPGFLLPKAISDALANQSKTQSQKEDALV
ncbi:putative nitric-oxide synthase (NADPH) [Helianthus annuus]|uniref:Nitric-oxide synthase (NADPH) n=1 Tax=Helianthus annuus TaxID=4232 RepID=A0A251V167_HELAN|nr:GTP-binding protein BRASSINAZOLE INSENSITIVE PALE GREEN 2, chloroplastic [Helianthus annuus]KAF5811590.1 putative nitric-oxide synthase (NADPH) [Helianthus annuus]KAJ0590409.1 putative nitric-oxide synthase (NADPH) [Helianthus annuus]KAJ0932695.1 putative nitric-oxide synthase (NADPH) [Helianthus annuus]